MPYNKHDMGIYNKGYYAGGRYVVKRVIAYLNGFTEPVCFKCMDNNIYRLQIHEPNGNPKKNRNFEDWIKVDELELLCENCHPETEGWRNRK